MKDIIESETFRRSIIIRNWLNGMLMIFYEYNMDYNYYLLYGRWKNKYRTII